MHRVMCIIKSHYDYHTSPLVLAYCRFVFTMSTILASNWRVAVLRGATIAAATRRSRRRPSSTKSTHGRVEQCRRRDDERKSISECTRNAMLASRHSALRLASCESRDETTAVARVFGRCLVCLSLRSCRRAAWPLRLLIAAIRVTPVALVVLFSRC